MPKFKELKHATVPNLKSIGLHTSTEYVQDFIGTHSSPENCKLCSTSLPIKGCESLLQLKGLLNIPWDIAESVLHNIDETLNKKDDVIYMRYLLYTLFEMPCLCIPLLKVSDAIDYYFVKRFGKYVHAASFSKRRSGDTYMLYFRWRLLLKNLQNIQILDILCINKPDDRLFSTIGQECNQLRQIRGIQLPRTANPTPLLKLIHKSAEVKQKCCETLEVIELCETKDSSPPKRFEFRIIWDKVLTSLFTNLRNLKSLKDPFNVDEVFCFHRLSRTQTGIREVITENASVNVMKLMKTLCPKLEKLELINQDNVTPLRELSSFPFLNSISLIHNKYGVHPSSDSFYKGILSSPLRNVRKIILESAFLPVLDLSILAHQIPAISEFRCYWCDSITWDGTTCFPNLRIFDAIITSRDRPNLSWLESFSETICHLSLICSFSLDDALRDKVLEVSFASLNCLILYYCDFANDFIFLKDLITNSPALERFELKIDDCKIVQLLKQFMDKANFNCTVDFDGSHVFLVNLH